MVKTITILSVVILCCATQVKAQTSGDECWDAMTASIAGPNYFDTSSATPSNEPDPDEAMCSGTYLGWNSSPDVWFVFTPTVNDTYNFSTCNVDSYDTSMVLYSGSCGSLVQIACNGDSANTNNNCQSYYSEIEMSLFAGTEYFVRIGGYNGAVGFGELTVAAASGGGTGNIWYVDRDTPATGGGTSWSDAFRTIEEALAIAVSTDQIWIAEGTYTPTIETDIGDPRSVSFTIREPVSMYGGFDGTELSVEDRDVSLHHTILTGDLNGDDNAGGNNSENAYHVITSSNVTTGSITIDGFWIYGGNANDAIEKLGGGIHIHNSTTVPLEVNLCRIQGNNAIDGGAIGVDSGSSVSLLKVKVKLNIAGSYGGGVYVNGDLSINTSEITGNESTIGGGIIATGNISITNTTISQNAAIFTGGVSAHGSSVDVYNSILWGNESTYGSTAQINRNGASATARYSCIEELPNDLNGNGNIAANPHFANPLGDDGVVRTGDENFHLFQGSPCIDAGDNTLVTTVLDLAGNFRFIDDPYTVDTGNNPTGSPIADMGPYELIPAVIGQDGVRIWSELISTVFQDEGNWLPNSVPGEFDTALFDVSGIHDVVAAEAILIDNINVTQGRIKFDLNGYFLQFRNIVNPIQIGQTGTRSFLGIKNGSVYAQGDMRISGEWNELEIDSTSFLYSTNLYVENGATLNIGNEITSDIFVSGGVIDLGGTNIASATIIGSLNETDPARDPYLPSKIVFDIQGSTQGISYDYLNINGFADLTNVAIQLRYDWTPSINQTFDFISATPTITGTPSVMTYSGLPSNLGCEWSTDGSLLGGGDATVVTTGPILFDGGTTTAISGTPNDIIVADFDGVNGSDIAMSIPSLIGGPASVEILLNMGMSGGVWQGFAAPISVSAGSSAEDLEIGDLDSDGSIDIAVTNYDDDTVTILLNDGTGNFTTTTLATGTGPICLAIADLDTSDGLNLPDLAVGCESSSPVGVQVYTNSTTLASRAVVFSLTSTWASPVPTSIDPTDVNDTKDLDLIILSNGGNSVTVKRGDGAGNTIDFMAFPFGLPSGSSPVSASIGTLNEDAYEDYITVNNGGDSLSILTGTGSTLNNPSTISIGDEPLSIATTDFDNDGDEDLVVSELDALGERQLAIIRNDSSGSTLILGIGDPVGNGSDPTFVATGDFDEDGLTDIVSVIDLAPDFRANSPALSLYLNITAVTCAADVDGSGSVDVDDLLALIAGWGSADPALDIDGSGTVDVDDLLILIGAWGPC
ncbi:MAG: VCBS repeat-containing protein [Planctomycetes bacterium]|nr:VCBS repeat-containing protein [Planctomycetota bacterium]